MKKIFILVFSVILVLGCINVRLNEDSGKDEKAVTGPVLRHVVLFKFSDSTTVGKVKDIEEAFRKLPEKIDVIEDFEWGTDISTEGLAQGFTHCFLVTFADEKGRDAYIPHPAHQEFVALAKPYFEKVLVLDYLSRD